MPTNLAPYPYAAAQQAIERRRQLALALQQQALEPITPPSIPGANASWSQGAAKWVQALLGNIQNQRLDRQQATLDKRIQDERTARAQNMADALLGNAAPTTIQMPAAPTMAMPIPAMPDTMPTTLGSPSLDVGPQGTPGTVPIPAMPTPVGEIPPANISRPVTLPVNSADEERLGALKTAIAQSFGSPDPAQQKFGEILLSKSLSGDAEARQQAFQMALERMKLQTTQEFTGGQNELNRRARLEAEERQQKFTGIQNELNRQTRLDVATIAADSRSVSEDEKINQLEIKRINGTITPAETQELAVRKSTKTLVGTTTFNLNNPAASGEDIQYWADQVQRDESKWELVKSRGKVFADAVGSAIAAKGGDVRKISEQSRSMAEMAQQILPHFPIIDAELTRLDQMGLSGPIRSRWREFTAGQNVFGSQLNTMTPEQKQLVGKFRDDIGLLKSGVARVHGGARGGGSIQMLDYMNTLLNAKTMDTDVLRGGLNGFKEWMTTYAGGPGGTLAPAPRAIRFEDLPK